MIPRRIEAELRAALARQAAVALIGPRQEGKTALAINLAEETSALYLDLENRTDREKLSDPALFLGQYVDRLVVLDEIHHVPGLFQPLRGLIDEGLRRRKRRGDSYYWARPPLNGSANLGKRLVKSPKVYVHDSGLLHALLDIVDHNTLCGHPVVGASWEGFVIENLLAAAPPRTHASFYRTAAGAGGFAAGPVLCRLFRRLSLSCPTWCRGYRIEGTGPGTGRLGETPVGGSWSLS